MAVALCAARPGRAETLTVVPDRFEIAGPHDGRQLLVTAGADGRRPRDLTREARFSTSPGGVVEVSPEGYVRPIGRGEATVTVEAGGWTASALVIVRGDDPGRPVHFANDVEPILSRYGCNAGGCHGKASGQNGFRLSLFGFDARFDYDAIVHEARGRRVFPAAPERSLILRKPAAQLPHGGGRLFTTESEPYQLLRAWIAQGVPVGDASAPTLRTLEVVPAHRVLDRRSRQQIAVLAHFSDGTTRDVTRRSQFQSNETGVAAVEPDGLVHALDLAGEAAVMARYQGLVAVFRATIPLETPGVTAAEFPAANNIDARMVAKWRSLGLVPSGLCTDGEFIRRTTLDLCGKLPTVEDVRAFVADPAPEKRARLIERLLDDKDYAAYFALRWGSILRNSPLAGSEQVAYAFHDWIRDMIARNRPYDEFVRGIVAASGEWTEAPAVNWFWQMRDDQLHQPVADTAQIFLGLRLQCAKCHHHPYERWGQDDYYGLAGFFARLGRKSFGEPPPYYASRTRTTSEVNPRTGKPIEPKLLDGPVLDVPPEEDPRQKLVDWMARPDNPFCAKALCNRMWGHLMGRGLVDPVDDMRATNPPSNPELLDDLARDFIDHHFDVKHLFRTICNSRTYQLSATPNASNQHDRQNHARFYAKRLIAEVALDALDQVCGSRTQFNKMSRQARAVDLPHEAFGSYFLDVFDRPPRSSPCECARSTGANLQQVLHLANSAEVDEKLSGESGRVARLARENVPPEAAVEELYLAAFARRPTVEELTLSIAHIGRQKEPRRGLEDVAWALLNSKEFLFNH